MVRQKPKEKNIMIFTENLRKRIVAEGFEEIPNLEGFLNRAHGKEDEIVLRGVKNWFKDKSGIYKPKSERNYLAIKSDQIDFVFATKKIEDSIYAQNNMPNRNQAKLPIMYGLHGLRHDLIGEITVSKNLLPETEKEQLLYVTKALKGKKFISFYNPRQRKLQPQFNNLFKGTALDGKQIPRILLNRTADTINTKSIYTGK